jgi:hypothetical protein
MWDTLAGADILATGTQAEVDLSAGTLLNLDAPPAQLTTNEQSALVVEFINPAIIDEGLPV